MTPRTSQTAEARTVFPGDERTGVKDPIVQRTADGGWQAWICCHPLDVADEEDRMTTAYATSQRRRRLGLARHGPGTAARDLGPARGPPDRRPRRRPGRLRRPGVEGGELVRAHRASRGSPVDVRASSKQVSDDAVADVRYLDVLPLPGGGYRIWYEARLPDESHELRTELIAGR